MSRAIGVLAIASLVIGAWACGAASELDGEHSGQDGSADGPVAEGGPDGCSGCVDGGPDVRPPPDTGIDVRPPPDTGVDVGIDVTPPPDTGVDVRIDVAPPPDTGVDVRPPPDTGVDVRIDVSPPPDTGVDVRIDVKPPPDTGTDVKPPPPDTGTDSEPDTAPPWDGGIPVTVATHESAQTLAADDTYVYWENSGGTVLNCPVAGCPSNIPTLLAFNGYGYGFETLAAAGSTAYYLDSSNDISDCASGGCALAPTVYEGTADGGYGYYYYQSLITDSANAYFTDGSSVYSCPLGATCSSPSTLASISTFATMGPLAVSSSDVFFVREGTYSGAIRSVPIGGGTEQTVCRGYVLTYVNSMVEAGGYVYFTSGYVSSTIYQCPAGGGGSPTVFATDVAPYAMATDGANLYWTNYTTGGAVVACAVGAACTSPRTVASGQDNPLAIAVNSTRVFWATTTDIYSAVK